MRFLDSAMLRIASLGMTFLHCGAKCEIAALGCASLAMTHWYWVVRITNNVAVPATAKLRGVE